MASLVASTASNSPECHLVPLEVSSPHCISVCEANSRPYPSLRNRIDRHEAPARDSLDRRDARRSPRRSDGPLRSLQDAHPPTRIQQFAYSLAGWYTKLEGGRFSSKPRGKWHLRPSSRQHRVCIRHRASPLCSCSALPDASGSEPLACHRWVFDSLGQLRNPRPLQGRESISVSFSWCDYLEAIPFGIASLFSPDCRLNLLEQLGRHAPGGQIGRAHV